MDFYQAQDDAHRKTKWLGVAFLLSVLTVMLLVGALITALFINNTELTEQGFPLELFLTSAGITGGAMILPFLFKFMELSRGGSVIAEDLGGRLIDSTPSNFHEQRLLNVVEEMALASGVAVPMVYVMDHENSINAFAAGTEPNNAAIGVTRGCLERLTREELQGVIAHEFSHILNGDMNMNMKMVSWVFGLMAVSMVGQMLFRSLSYGRHHHHRGSSDNNREGSGLMMALLALGIGLMVIGSIGMFFGRLLQAAISRQREYLADASAVQFTRNPDTIAGALEKIGGLREGSRITAPKASEASHMFFADGGVFSFGFATHPPLPVRISRIKAEWDGTFELAELPQIQHHHEARGLSSGLPVSALTGESPVASLTPPEEHLHLPPALAGLSPTFLAATRDPDDAQLLIFSMLIASEGGLNGKEAARLKDITTEERGLSLVAQWSSEMTGLHSLHKISLIDLSLPALRKLSAPSKQRFLDMTRELISADAGVSLFEYMLQRVIERHILRHAQGATYSRIQHKRLSHLSRETALISSLIEKCETESVTLTQTDITALDDALNRCNHASPLVKQQILAHLNAETKQDGRMTSKEAELLRTISDAIGCPSPLV